MRNLKIHLSRFSLVLLVALFTFLALPIAQVGAYTSFGIIIDAAYEPLNQQNKQLQLSDGRLVCSYIDNTNNRLVTYFISSTGGGSILATVYSALDATMIAGTQDFTVFLKNATYVAFAIIIGIPWSGTSSANFYFYVINVNSYTSTLEKLQINIGTTTLTHWFTISNIHTYSGKYYFIINAPNAYTIGFEQRILFIEYNPSTRAYTQKDEIEESIGVATQRNGWIFSFFNTTTKNIYFMTSTCADITRPNFYRADVVAGTMELLATNPSPDRWNNDPRSQMIQAGILWDSGDPFLYFTYLRSYIDGSNYPSYQLTQSHLKFNGTIEAALILNNYENVAIVEMLLPTGATPAWLFGYATSSANYTDIYVDFPQQVTGTTILFKNHYHVDDFFNPGGSIMQFISQEQNPSDILPWRDYTDIMWKASTSTYQANIELSTHYLWIYTGMSPFGADYDLTLTYTPMDVPPLTEKSYVFTATGTENTLGFLHYQIWYLDGTSIVTSVTSTTGVKKASLNIAAGIHNITIAMYSSDGSTYLYSEAWQYAWTTNPGPGVGGVYPGIAAGFAVLIGKGLPAFFLIFIPIVAFAKMGISPIIAAITGLGVGVTLCTLTGIFEPYMTFMFILVMAVVFVFMAKSGGGGSG